MAWDAVVWKSKAVCQQENRQPHPHRWPPRSSAPADSSTEAWGPQEIGGEELSHSWLAPPG